MILKGMQRLCKYPIYVGVLVVAAMLFLAVGCASQQKKSDRYIDQILAENLGDVESMRQSGATEKQKAVKNQGAAASRENAKIPAKAGKKAGTAKTASQAVAAASGDEPDIAATEAKADENGRKLVTDVTIQPDTVLWISVEEDPSLNGRYIVNDYSAIDFGYVGLVLMNDMTIKDAEAVLINILENRYLKKATVTVRMAKASYDRIGINGSVLAPGMLKIGPGSTITLNDALRRAGGLKLEATSARVKIVRGGLLSPFGVIADGEVYPLVSDDGKLTIPTLALANNDLVYVYAQKTQTAAVGEKRVIVLGEVSRKGVVQFADNEPCTLMYLLFKIGGLPRFAKSSEVRIVRRDKEGREREMKVDAEVLLRDGDPKDDVVLEDGDRVIVPVKKFNFL